ncbi:MAG: HPr kinase [Sphingomonas bacterium]|uniref:hypothetical protein n=1 Tax=Sphingomonas bacterium TaxID=1895847 RepID=UPI00262C6BC1|nr:hypothetical protein [Sphingomonas bacterium]MDB5705676.1 HPr kinase [Sphingomonas bacterium]
MHRYGAYGLTFETDCTLPFPPADGDERAAIRIVFTGRTDRLGPTGRDRRDLTRSDHGWCLRYGDVAGNWVAYDFDRQRRRLDVSTNMGWEECRYPLTGVVCGVLLSLEGGAVLHGSAIAHEGAGIVLIGDSGQGKSTLTAALIEQGAQFLTDDIVALGLGPDGYAIAGGARTLSLAPDAFAALEPGGFAELAEQRHDRDKRLVVPHGHRLASPLRAVFCLEAPDPARACSEAVLLSKRRGAMALLDNLYGTWIRPPGAADLEFCGAVAEATPIYLLKRPKALAGLPGTVRVISKALGQAVG